MLSKLLKTTQIKAGVLSLLNAKLDAKVPTKHFNQTYENFTSAAAFQPSKTTE